MGEELARATVVAKAYGDCVAVRTATCIFRAGEIQAVCGENGAGKSTLLKMVAGMIVPDAGEVVVRGTKLLPHTPREAIARGVAMVLQHFALVPVFTALENVVLGAEPRTGFGTVDWATARARLERVTARLGMHFPLDVPVSELGVGDRQRLEIARALYRDAQLVILDEPTAVLTKVEANALYAALRALADEGKGIVVVTHKMDEVRAHADVVTVMRRGELVFTRTLDRSADVAAQVDEVTAGIMGAVHGGRGARAASHEAPAVGETVLEVRGVSLGRALDGIDLELRAGEIVGIAGVEGNGQHELVGVLAGELAPDRGAVKGARTSVVREDRQHDGLVLDADLRDNLVLGELGDLRGKLGTLDLGAIEGEAEKRLAASGANADLDRTARSLSGGNQQKIVVARALARLESTRARRARVLVASQPTRGVDLAAAADIHERLREAAREGAGVLVLSADLDELRSLASRILVIARGRLVAAFGPDVSDEEIGRHMLGLSAEERSPTEAA